MNNQDHAIATLGGVIRRSIAVLRLCVEDLRTDPTRVVMDRTLDESVTLSAAVAQLARLVDLSTLDTATTDARPDSGDMLAQADNFLRIVNWEKHGPCCICGLTLPDP